MSKLQEETNQKGLEVLGLTNNLCDQDKYENHSTGSCSSGGTVKLQNSVCFQEEYDDHRLGLRSSCMSGRGLVD